VIVGAFAAVLAFAAPQRAGAAAFAEHGPIAYGASPTALVAGAGGAMWFAEAGDWSAGWPAGIGRVARGGTVTEFRAGLAAHASPTQLVRTPDGRMWFLDASSDTVGRVTADGAIREAPVRVPDVAGIAPGADGHLWFVADGGATVGWVGTNGAVHRFTPKRPASGGPVTAVAAGPGRRLWFTAGVYVVSVTTRGKATWRRYPGASSYSAVAAGTDGRLWLAANTGRLFRVDARGRLARSVTSHRFHRIAAMTAGTAGRMWLSQTTDDEIGEISARGHLTWWGPGGHDAGALRATSLARDARGRLWAAGQDRVVRLVTGRTCAVADVVTLTPADARSRLHAHGCAVRMKTSAQTGAGPTRIVAQSPPGGRVSARGRVVTLTVGPLACRYPTGWTVVQRSEAATIAVHTRRDRTDETTRWSGCANAVGEPTPLAVSENDRDDDYGGWESSQLSLAGTWVLLERTTADRYGGASLLELRDLATSAPVRSVVELDADFASDLGIVDSVVNGTGAVAWVQHNGGPANETSPESLLVKPLDGVARTLTASAASITGLRIDADTVHWTEDGLTRSAPIAP
jgi:virginiamycin B lyase